MSHATNAEFAVLCAHLLRYPDRRDRSVLAIRESDLKVVLLAYDDGLGPHTRVGALEEMAEALDPDDEPSAPQRAPGGRS